MPYSTQPTKYLISPDGKLKMANSFLPQSKELGAFPRTIWKNFSDILYHILQTINPSELCGFGDHPLSVAFMCSQPGVGSCCGVMRGCSATWRLSSCCPLLKPEQDKEEDPAVLGGGGGEDHTWLLERTSSPSFASELKPCHLMSNHSGWPFTLKPRSEEYSPVEVRAISN